VRADGLGAVLGSLLRDPRIVTAVLVDVDSGMVLDACTQDGPDAEPGGAWVADLEVCAAGHAELVRVARALPGRAGAGTADDELMISTGAARHHLLRAVPDPHGDRLVLSVVVDGSRRYAERVRKRLRTVAVDALTAGPTVVRRPGTGVWHAAATSPRPVARPTARSDRGEDVVDARPWPSRPAGLFEPAAIAGPERDRDGNPPTRRPAPPPPPRPVPVRAGTSVAPPPALPGRRAVPRPVAAVPAGVPRPPAPPSALPPGRRD